MAVADPELEKVRRAFDGAFGRMCAATNAGQLEDELSNLLSQLYRLGELCKRRLGKPQFYKASASLAEARAALWIRRYDTHELVTTALVGDVYTDYYTEMYGVLVWSPLTSIPVSPDNYGRDVDYKSSFENRAVLGTIRIAFDQLAALL